MEIILTENQLRDLLTDALIEFSRGKGASVIIKESIDEAISLYKKVD